MIATFDELIAPISAKVFRAEHQEPKRPGLFRGEADRFRDALNWRTFGDLLNDIPRFDSKYRLTVYGCEAPEDQWLTRPNPLKMDRAILDSSVIARHLRNGHTCVLREVEGFSRGLQSIATALEQQFGGMCGGNLFFSQPHGSAVPGHCDFPDLFVVQLEGRKRWRLCATPDEKFLVRKETYAEPVEGFELQVSEEHVLEPGDVLYVPSGVFHAALAVEPSLHVSFGIIGINLPHFLRFVLAAWRSERAAAYTWDRIDQQPDFERVFGEFSRDVLGSWGESKRAEFATRYYTPREWIDIPAIVEEVKAKAVAPAEV